MHLLINKAHYNNIVIVPTEKSSSGSTIDRRMKNPYRKVSSNSNSKDNGKDKGAVILTIPIEMMGGISRGSLAFAVITAWTVFMLISAAIANHNAPPPPPPLSSSFFEISPIDITSSYEEHWAGSKVPKWAKKKITYHIPKENRMCFTHVG